jgi:hypothetical protein
MQENQIAEVSGQSKFEIANISILTDVELENVVFRHSYLPARQQAFRELRRRAAVRANKFWSQEAIENLEKN